MLGTFLLGALSAWGAGPQAFVTANPSYYDYGSVPQGQMRSSTIWFQNHDKDPVQFFNVTCNDYTGQYRCSSNCFYLPPYGSCSVYVQFYAQRGDNLRSHMQVTGYGSGGAYATSSVYATDAPPR